MILVLYTFQIHQFKCSKSFFFLKCASTLAAKNQIQLTSYQQETFSSCPAIFVHVRNDENFGMNMIFN